VDKKQIDEFYIELLPMLRTIIRGVKYKKNRAHLNEDMILNETYLYIYEKVDLMKDKDIMQRIVINFINQNIGWLNSKLNKVEKVNNNEDFYDTNYDIRYSEYLLEQWDRSESSLDTKIEIEKWYMDSKCLLVEYRNQLECKLMKIIFDCYFNKNITSGKELAVHLGINKDYASRYIRELKKDIRSYIISIDSEKQ
jgi:hypothetical protein